MTTSVSLAPPPILQFFNNINQFNAGGSILTQVGGSNYPTYQDPLGNTPLPNPIPLNSRGEVSNASGVSCQLFLQQGVTYTFTIYDANGNQIDQPQYVTAPEPSISSLASIASGTVGSVRKGSMSVTAASATATFTADEIIVAAAVGGAATKLANFSQSINLATVGAGGMDSGTAPINGFVCIYAATNPISGAVTAFACNVTTSSGSVYSGVNAPAGFTETALVSVWPTNGSGQFVIGDQFDRVVCPTRNTVLSSATLVQATTSLSIASAVPPNATSVFGSVRFTGVTGTGSLQTTISSNNGFLGYQVVLGYSVATPMGSNFANVPLVTPQTIYYGTNNTGVSAATTNIDVTGYTF